MNQSFTFERLRKELHVQIQSRLEFEVDSSLFYNLATIDVKKLKVFKETLDFLITNNTTHYMTFKYSDICTSEPEILVKGCNPVKGIEIINPRFSSEKEKMLIKYLE